MPISNEVENKQRTERKDKIRSVIKQAVSDTKNDSKTVEKVNKPIELEDKPKNIKGKRQHWGYHLLLDCGGCNKKIDDEKDIENFLKQLLKEIKMKPLGEPTVIRVDNEEEGRGISGFQMLTTSHISAHFDDSGNNGYIDIFSCAPFDPKTAIKCVKKHFDPKHIGDLFVHRDSGDWPHK